MNSKIITFILLTMVLSSCGVKAPPLKHPETIVDSYVQEYTGDEYSEEEQERLKNETIIESPQSKIQSDSKIDP